MYYLSMHSILLSMLFSDRYILQPTRWRLRFYFTSELMIVVVVVVVAAAARVVCSLSP